jgi:Asp-tRNA(Asn)/Glu-tRNA(Gln) amidotransferase A subunit family amidase
MATCVADLAILLQTIDGSDPLVHKAESAAIPPYAGRLAQVTWPPKLGRLRGFFDERADTSMTEHVESIVSMLRDKGAKIFDVAVPAAFSEVIERHRIVMAVEAAMFHELRLRKHPADYQPNITTLLNEGLACAAPEYARCKQHQLALRDEMQFLIRGFDAVLTPATKGPAPDAATTGDPVFNSPWSYTGLPTVSIPSGLSADGMPLAIQLVGFSWCEEDLFAVAAWCEKAVGFTIGEPPLTAR